jgi:hypothetical protein
LRSVYTQVNIMRIIGVAPLIKQARRAYVAHCFD